MSSNRPVIVITHAAFDTDRRFSLGRLVSQLRLEAPQIEVIIAKDYVRKGSLWCWEQAMRMGLDSSGTHIVWLPDDAIVCKDFGRILEALVDARPNDVFDCFVNHREDVSDITTLWYSTPDGYVGLGGVMPRNLLEDHLAWRAEQISLTTWPNDAGVNTWCMATGRKVYKTSMSFVMHDLTVPSLDGHDSQKVERAGQRPATDHGDVMAFLGATYMAPEEHRLGWSTSCTDLGKTYDRTELMLLELNPPSVEAYWDVQRGHRLMEDAPPSVFIATPAYMGDVKAVFAVALLNEMRAAHEKGIAVGWSHLDDPAIDRCRNRLVSQFMASDATHMLFWDGDNIPTTYGWIGRLVDSGHDIVGGAVVQKNGTSRDFAVQLVSDDTGSVTVENGCVKAFSVGTGFLMITRKAIVAMMKENMDKWYLSHRGAEWNLFSGTVSDHVHCAEDYEFCRKWRIMGGSCYILPEIDFEHIGAHKYSGSFKKSVFCVEGDK